MNEKKNPEVKQEEEASSFLGKVGKLFGLSGKRKTVAKPIARNLTTTFKNIRGALARYAASNQDLIPSANELYDWQSLRQIVSRYGKRPLPATEAEAGLTAPFRT